MTMHIEEKAAMSNLIILTKEHKNEREFIKTTINKWANDSLESFIQTLKTSPNCMVCSQRIFDIIEGKKTEVDGNIYWHSCRVIFVKQNVLLWYCYHDEADLDNLRELVNDIDVDLMENAKEEYLNVVA